MTVESDVAAFDVGSARVIRLRGDIDLELIRRLRTAVAQSLADRPDRLVIDLAEVLFIDSMGLGVLITGCKDAQRAGMPYLLGRPSPFVAKLLQTTALTSMFDITQDVPE